MPTSAKMVTVQYVVQWVPYVKGQVIKIHAKANQLLKKGDLLLEMNGMRPVRVQLGQGPARGGPGRSRGGESQAGRNQGGDLEKQS